MPTNRDISDFQELRQGLQGMVEFASTMLEAANAGLGFLDRQFGERRLRRGKTNGNGNGVDALRERVKRHYTRRQPQASAFVSRDAITEPVAPARRLTGAEKRLAQRAASAAILEALDLTEPRPITATEGRRAIGALVRRGYAKKKGDGYVRTKKAFVVGGPSNGNGAAAQSNGNGAAPHAPQDEASSDGQSVSVPRAAVMMGVSDSYVRLLMKQKKLEGHREMRVPKGGIKPMSMLVVDRDEIARYIANNR